MIIGHKNIRKRLKQVAIGNRLAQAYVFFGPEGLGKFLVAKEFAQFLIGNTGFSLSKDSRDSLDLLIVEPEREEEKGIIKEKDIAVEVLREALKRFDSPPYAGKKSVLIIRDAHRLTESSQNTLLKTLEEPQEYAIIILVTHEMGVLLPTTLSRCQKIPFQPVSVEEMEHSFQETAQLSASQKNFFFSLGRPGIMMQALQDPDRFHEKSDLLENLFRLSEMSLSERLALAETMASDIPQTIQILEWWMSGLRVVSMRQKEMIRPYFMRVSQVWQSIGYIRQSPSSARLLLENLFLHW